MAVDESLLETLAGEKAIVRFYEWEPATLSLGYFQRLGDREQHLASQACPLVRRSTGGGAIIHDEELTYSFAAATKHPLAGSAERLYELFHLALVRCLTNWRVSATLCDTQRVSPRARQEHSSQSKMPFLCFQSQTPGDVLIGSDKVAGSAQRRRRQGILQHGSILISTSESAPELPGLNELAASQISPRELRSSLLDELTVLGPLRTRELTAEELQHAKQVENQRYGDTRWNNRR